MEIPEWLAELASDSSLTPKMTAALRVIGAQPKFASFASSREIADQARINNATVIRMSQALGFNGWTAFRGEIRAKYIASLTAPEVAAEHSARSGHPATRTAHQDMENLALFARRLDTDIVDQIAGVIAGARHTTAVAAGSYVSVAMLLAHVATVLGFPVHAEMRGGSHLANALRPLDVHGCLVAVSFWRLHRETLRAARIAAERGATVCVITDSATTPLADVATHLLITPSESGGFFPSLTASVCAANAILATLEARAGGAAQSSIALMEHTWQDLDLYHR